MADTPDRNDHPQTIKNEPDARGSDAGADAALFKQQQERAQEHSDDENAPSQQASPLDDLQSALGDDAEAIRRHAHGGRSMGDALGSSAGRDVGSRTPGDSGDLGGGDPQKV
jgi:hypothetical protein